MPFNENARLDTSQVSDRRGLGGGPVAIGAGGGGIGLIIMLVIYLLLGGDPSSLMGVTQQGTTAQEGTTVDGSTLAESCKTGKDANSRDDCRAVGYINSIQAYWTDEFKREGRTYPMAQTVFFSGSTTAACGYASSATGPFYCPTDKIVYVDLSFFQELRSRFGAKGGPFTQAYVLSHEYGHHVQDVMGVLNNTRGAPAQGPQGSQVRIELQADCLAGVWIHNATTTGYLTSVSDAEIADALDAAAAVGDDRIQSQTQGRVSPESFTHGTSQQRQKWLGTGVKTGDPAACDTSKGL